MKDMILFNTEIKDKLPSLYQAFLANEDSLKKLDDEESSVQAQILEMEKKMEIARDLKLPLNRLKNAGSRLKNRLDAIAKMRTAYSSGYLEIPRLQRSPQNVGREGEWWGFRFNKDTPLRVLEALKRAKNAKIFHQMVVFREGGSDPILAGRIDDRFFYLASWR